MRKLWPKLIKSIDVGIYHRLDLYLCEDGTMFLFCGDGSVADVEIPVTLANLQDLANEAAKVLNA